MIRAALLAGLLAGAPGDPGLDWPQWRGPAGSGVSEASGLPERWGSSENVLWKAELPGRGVSSPILARGRIYLTASSGAQGDHLHVLAFDAASGRRLWERRFRATAPAQCNP
ncbi:MAG: PQQ-binding-like beta-propeller repeat protein, partial [Thermoanaerobaculia bacterium]